MFPRPYRVDEPYSHHSFEKCWYCGNPVYHSYLDCPMCDLLAHFQEYRYWPRFVEQRSFIPPIKV